MLKRNGSNILTVVHDVFMDTINIELSLGTFSLYVAGIYASLAYTSHLNMWLHLIDLRNTVDGPWMVIEDFNDVIHPSEQKEGNFNHFKATTLLNVIDICNLVEVDMTGGNSLGIGPWLTFLGAWLSLMDMLMCFANFTLITTSFSLGVVFLSKTTGRILLSLRQLGSLTHNTLI